MTDTYHLLHNLLLFVRVLRGLGLPVNTGQVLDLFQALEYIPLTDRIDFYHTARCLFVQRQQDLALFDAAFAVFWQKPLKVAMPLSIPTHQERPAGTQPLVAPSQPGNQPNPAALDDDRPVELQATRTYSAHEHLRHKDFASLTTGEEAAIKRLLAESAWALETRPTRRWQPGQGHVLDYRRTLRQAGRTGGEVLTWAQRQRRQVPRPLVILADISGSMESYSRLLIHFIYALSNRFTRRVEAFVFGTRLTRITRQLQGHDIVAALAQVSRQVPDWSGGTRIGAALKTFNADWGRRTQGQGAVVLLISDGWDRGDVALLRREMARLRRNCHRLVWLNPLLGIPGYEPLTAGMQAALPYVDDFLPAHNLASLEVLGRHLAGCSLQAWRPTRL